VVIIDGDLQDPPSLIHEMLEKWREGNQVVYAQRHKRAGETLFKKWSAIAITGCSIFLPTLKFRPIQVTSASWIDV
jgi:glycosyltransferase involved in cell wall biosynthesis